MNNNLIAAIEDQKVSKKKTKKIYLKDHLYIQNDIIILNMKEWRNQKLYNKMQDFIQNYIKKITLSNQDMLNIFTDTKKIKLNNEIKYIDISESNNIDNFSNKFLNLNGKESSIIVKYSKQEININSNNNYIKKFFEYYSFLNNLKEFFLLYSYCFEWE